MLTDARAEELLAELYRVLPTPMTGALRVLVKAAVQQGKPLYTVGGTVRDLLLGRPVLDVDLVVEGEAIAVAQAAAALLRADVVVHRAFGTATVRRADLVLDLATARQETYPRPGALPLVRPATIEADLARRDFSINAMALRLTPQPHVLLDPFGGRHDLEAHRIRALHERSFQDDATRMLRAVRYAGRLGFEIEPETAALLRRDRSYLDTISGTRVFHEVLRIFEDTGVVSALRLAHELSLLSAVHPTLGADATVLRGVEAALASGHEAAAPPTLLCIIAIGVKTPPDAASLSRRLMLPRRFEQAISDLVRLREMSPELCRPDLRPSEVAELLDPLSPYALWAVAFVEGDTLAGQQVRRYLETWRSIRPHLRGRDLIALGIPQGPAVRAWLQRLRAARLDGLAQSRADELALVQRGM